MLAIGTEYDKDDNKSPLPMRPRAPTFVAIDLGSAVPGVLVLVVDHAVRLRLDLHALPDQVKRVRNSLPRRPGHAPDDQNINLRRGARGQGPRR
jgi:hypothetical protein